MNRNDKKWKLSTFTISVLLVMVIIPQLAPLIIVGYIIYALIKKNVKSKSAPAKKDLNFRYHVDMPKSTPKPTPEAPAKNDAPGIFCFHRDKAVHHVYQGKEVDPWDRPDTDISKYQHR